MLSPVIKVLIWSQVIGSVSAVLGHPRLYGDEYKNSPAKANVSSIAFAGTVAGMLIFGYTSDKWSRKNSLLVSTICLAVFTALAAGSYGYKGSIQGMFAALTAWRFLVGVVRFFISPTFKRIKIRTALGKGFKRQTS